MHAMAECDNYHGVCGIDLVRIYQKSRVALLGSFVASYAMEIASEENHSKIIDKFALKASPF